MPQELKIRILCGPPAAVQADVNQLLELYAPTVWNIQPGPDGPLVTCILVLESEIRKAQLMAARMSPGRPI